MSFTSQCPSKRPRSVAENVGVSERASELFLKGGVHVADRGNVALPQDIVKVLKTQDENYVRTMRAAGLKVYTSSCVETLF
jgi:uncharacterized protein YbaP (TraB family)